MELKNPRLLGDLMAEHNLSARQMAVEAGWKSHSYMNRLLAGQVKTLNTEPALRIAHRLQVPVSLLFRTRVSTDNAQSVKGKRARAA